MATPWCFIKTGQRFGCFSGHEITEIAIIDKFTKDDLVQKFGDGSIVPADQVKGLFCPDKSVGNRPETPRAMQPGNSVAPSPLQQELLDRLKHISSGHARTAKAAEQLAAGESKKTKLTTIALPSSYLARGKQVLEPGHYAHQLSSEHKKL